jgi:hypothetical protein
MGAVVTLDCSRDLGGSSNLVTSGSDRVATGSNGHVADPH